MIKLISIIYGLLMLIKSYQTKKEQEVAQNEADKIDANPSDWFNNHFDGMHSKAETSSNKAAHSDLRK